jgi:hypothetical protein
MQINMKIIEHEGIKYPLIIDLNAMEDFQKSFFAETGKNITESESFENFGLTAGIIQFQAALNEGIDYENQIHKVLMFVFGLMCSTTLK